MDDEFAVRGAGDGSGYRRRAQSYSEAAHQHYSLHAGTNHLTKHHPRRSRSNSRVDNERKHDGDKNSTFFASGDESDTSNLVRPSSHHLPLPIQPSTYYQSSPRKRSKSWVATERHENQDRDRRQWQHQAQQQNQGLPRRTSRNSRSSQSYNFENQSAATSSSIHVGGSSKTNEYMRQNTVHNIGYNHQRPSYNEYVQALPMPTSSSAYKNIDSSSGYATSGESWILKASRWIGIQQWIYRGEETNYQSVPQHAVDPMIEMRQYGGNSAVHDPPSPCTNEPRATEPFSPPIYPRMIDRGHDNKPGGRIFVRKRIKKKDWYALYGFDWFHSLIDAPTSRIILILMSLYLGIVIIYAILYYEIHCFYFCDLDFNTFVGAFDFALETMATIGYGTKNIYFDDCIIVSICLASQMCIRLILDAFVIGVIYCRIARPNARASTVIFSNKAVIRRIRGKLYFMFQLCELRKHQLVEAHVRLYLVKREVDESVMDYHYRQERDASAERPYEEDVPTRDDANAPNERGQRKKPQHYPSNNRESWQEIGRYTYQHHDHHWDHGFEDDDYVMTNPSDSGGHGRRRRNRGSTGSLSGPGQSIPAKSLHNRSSSSNGDHSNNQSRFSASGMNDSQKADNRTSGRSGKYQYGGEKIEKAQEYTYLQTCSMRLNHPNDELGGMLLLMVPQVVVHELDATSPLMPPPMWISAITGEVVRWNPPAFRPFEATTSKPSLNPRKSPKAGLKSPSLISSTGSHRSSVGQRERLSRYDMNSLSSISFPNVMRRSSDFLKTTIAHPEESPSHSLSTQNHVKQHVPQIEVTDKTDDIKVPAHAVFSTADWSSSSCGVLSVQDIDTSKETVNEDTKVRTPDRSNVRLRLSKVNERSRSNQHISPGESWTGGRSDADHVLISPGMQRYESHLMGMSTEQHIGATNGSGRYRQSSRGQSSYYQHDGQGSPRRRQGSQENLGYNYEMDTDGDNDHDYDRDDVNRVYSHDYEPSWQQEEKEMLQRYLLDRQIEVVAVVEGVDSATGGNVQARHSYIVNEIEWDKRFQHCVYQDPEDFYATVDFDLFHELTDAPKDAAYPGPVPSSI